MNSEQHIVPPAAWCLAYIVSPPPFFYIPLTIFLVLVHVCVIGELLIAYIFISHSPLLSGLVVIKLLLLFSTSPFKQLCYETIIFNYHFKQQKYTCLAAFFLFCFVTYDNPPLGIYCHGTNEPSGKKKDIYMYDMM